MKENPLKKLEEPYSLRILQYLQLNPTGKTFDQIISAISPNASPSQILDRLRVLEEMALVTRLKGDGFRVVFFLTKTGKMAAEAIWDLFRIIVRSYSENTRRPSDKDVLDFYK